ncbi:MAG TPA: PAS domain-containing sensor histidine kinase [Coleofasciculaceae cyanobacterium]
MRTSEQIKVEIEDKFGFFPPFFTPALTSPQVLENLWQQTLAAYVNNPLSALFKEKLSAYLSRYCAVPYCMISHSCSLRPLGVKAQEVLELLESPPPTEIEIDEHLGRLTAYPGAVIVMSELDAALEESLLYCAIFIALEREQAEYCRNELRRFLGAGNYQLLVSLIAYVRTCHAWMEAHPEIAYRYEADKRVQDYLGASLEEEPSLVDFFRNYVDKVRQEQQTWAEQLAAIAERKRNEEALRQSEKKYRSVVESVKEVIFQTDLTGVWTFLNRAWTEITGFTVEESIGTNWFDYIYPSDRQYNFEQFKPLLERQKEYCRYEIRYLTKDAGIRWIEVYARLTLNAEGIIVGTSGTLHDMTERKKAEEEIRKALEKEKELSELKSRFVSMTSHEFRTPLTTILTSSELLEHYSHKWTEEKKLSHIQRIQTAVHHMTDLLNDVLLIGKAEAGKLEFNPYPLDVTQFCLSLVEELQLSAKRQHTQTKPHFTISFVNHTQGLKACLDEKLLRHILSNLLSNAIKYSPQGSVIHFELAASEAEVIFQIQDQGIGIPLEDQQRLFESFHRASNVGEIQGTGLGLAIVKKSVDFHKGKIDLNSVVGVGSTFTVTLPLNPTLS